MKQIIAIYLCGFLFSVSSHAQQIQSQVDNSLSETLLNPEAAKSSESSSSLLPLDDKLKSQVTPIGQSLTPNLITEVNQFANYQLAPGDSLMISVWKEEGLQEQQYLVSPDGTIIFPLIGTVIAAGKSITELKEQLVTRLADYIADPSVTVKLLNNQGNSVFVIGKVNRPGQYYSGRKVDVMQALSLAGGLTVFAKQSSISILRRVGNEIKVFSFDYSDVINGDEVGQNILLEPGDTITVP